MEFDKEDFLEDISCFPQWIKNVDDLVIYCTHIKYRMLQSKNKLQKYEDMFTLSEIQSKEIYSDWYKFDEAYEQRGKMTPFADWAKDNDH